MEHFINIYSKIFQNVQYLFTLGIKLLYNDKQE